MSDRLQAVFFDVGGTLIEPWPSVGAVYARVAQRHGIPADAAELETAFRRAWHSLKESPGGLTSSHKDWWRRVVFTVFAGRATEEYFEDLYASFARAEAWRVFADVPAALRLVRSQGWHLGLISNWDERLRPLLQDLQLSDWDSLTISCEVGVEKPQPAIFQAALRAAGVAAAQALHIGDSVDEDRRGAEAVGLRAALVDRPRIGLCELLARYAA